MWLHVAFIFKVGLMGHSAFTLEVPQMVRLTIMCFTALSCW